MASKTLSSLKIVNDELTSTLQQAMTHMEQFTESRDSLDLLDTSLGLISQAEGAFRIVQLPGADLLCQELSALGNEIRANAENVEDSVLTELGTGFFILLRYLEFSISGRRLIPEILLNYINRLRLIRKQSLYPESYFFRYDTTKPLPKGTSGNSNISDISPAFFRRIRHMYQVGLLKVIRNQKPRANLTLMTRAVERIAANCQGTQISNLLDAFHLVLQALKFNPENINDSRKRLFAAIDREMKRLEKGGLAAIEQTPSSDLAKQVLYILASTSADNPHVQTVLKYYGVEEQDMPMPELELLKEQERIRGPGSDTLVSVMSVMKEEIRIIKDILDVLSQGAAGTDDYAPMVGSLTKIADILAVIGLGVPAKRLKTEAGRIDQWVQENYDAAPNEFIEVADALLYVESAITNLNPQNLTPEHLKAANSEEVDSLMASSHLAEAEKGVIKEALAGLALIKRALSSYSENDYDQVHISNVPSTLSSVRGGLTVLSLTRAVGVVTAANGFIQEAVQGHQTSGSMPAMLETFADAIIGLEYYLESLYDDANTEDVVLELAEESLAALGYPVDS